MQKENNPSNNIFVYSGIDAVRKRPGMYIGNIEDGTGYQQMIYEIICNSIDEVLSKKCNIITVIIHKDNSISIEDNGRGIPIEFYKDTKIPICELLATTLHSGGKFNNKLYKFSSGTNGVGLSVVNALSTKLQLIIYKNNIIYEIFFYKGKRFSKLKQIGICNKTGTLVRFTPDLSIFKYKVNLIHSNIENKINELVYLNKNLIINFYNQNINYYKSFCSKNGLTDFINHVSKNYEAISSLYSFYETNQLCDIDILMKWTSLNNENILCYTNCLFQNNGGDHLLGFKLGLNKFFNYLLKKYKKNKQITYLYGEDIRMGLIAIISIKTKNPKFTSQTKDKLVSNEIKKNIENFVFNQMKILYNKNYDNLKKLFDIIFTISYNRYFKKKTKILKKKNSINQNLMLKNQNSDLLELFIVEGESAGGSAKQAKSYNQFVFSLQGKLLNVIKNEQSVFLYKEFINLIKLIGFDIINRKIVLIKLNFKKIIIMTDADVDGSHISTLVLVFFIKYLPNLILNGNIFLAKPPLFFIKINSISKYLFNKSSLCDIKKYFIYKKNFIRNQYFKYSNYSLIFFTQKNYLLNKSLVDELNYLVFKLINKYCFNDYTFLFNFCNSLIYIYKFNLSFNLIYLLNTQLFEIEIFFNEKQKKIIRINNLFFQCKKNENISFNIEHFFILKNKKYFLLLNFYQLLLKLNTNKVNFFVQRYKGLGEMNSEQLKFTTMNPNYRKLIQLYSNNIKKTSEIIHLLMGNNNFYRKCFFIDNLSK